MRTFREIAIMEKFKFSGKIKNYEKLLFEAYIEFLKDYYKVNKNIEISFRKPNKKKYFGFIDLVALQSGKNKIIVENTPYGILGKIGHEFTHIAQFLRGDLNYTKDEKSLLWKGKEFITIKEYSKISDMNEHKKLPWEKEAYAQQDILPGKFKESKFLNDIIGQDASLDFGIENDLWF